jgi:hypothetical protein
MQMCQGKGVNRSFEIRDVRCKVWKPIVAASFTQAGYMVHLEGHFLTWIVERDLL